MEDVITTRSGYERLQERLKKALAAYDAVCATNAHAAGDGDTSVWHDNFAYEHNQREMHKWARQITDLKKILARVRVISYPLAPSTVQVGAVIKLRDVNANQEWRFEVAGYEDGDAEKKRISYTAPLMKTIMGSGVGDEHDLFLGGKKRVVMIATIDRADDLKGETT